MSYTVLIFGSVICNVWISALYYIKQKDDQCIIERNSWQNIAIWTSRTLLLKFQ